MTTNNKADNKIDDHCSHNQELHLDNTEFRVNPHKDDLNQPRHKVKDPTLKRDMITTHRTSQTTTETTLTGPSRKTTDLRHSKQNKKSFGGSLNCAFQALL
jgi:hypothetical protein